MVATVLLVLVAWSWVVTGLEPFAGSTTAAVLVTGGVAVAAGAAWRPHLERPRPSLRPLVPWAVVAGALVAWQLAAFVQEPRSEHPTISSLTNAALDGRLTRTLAFAGWTIAAGRLARR